MRWNGLVNLLTKRAQVESPQVDSCKRCARFFCHLLPTNFDAAICKAAICRHLRQSLAAAYRQASEVVLAASAYQRLPGVLAWVRPSSESVMACKPDRMELRVMG
jgi:hypothetical protein